MKNLDCEMNLKAIKPRSAWENGVILYALEMLEGTENHEVIYSKKELKKVILDGAQDWKEYSYAGCALVYNADIAARLCNRTELKKTQGGKRQPNRYENWLDVQARALSQAFEMLAYWFFFITNGGK